VINHELFVTRSATDPGAYPSVGIAVSGTDTYYSELISGRDTASISLDIGWTGTPTGTLTLWGSNLLEPDQSDDDDWEEIAWTPTDPAGSAADFESEITGNAARWKRIKYVNASGSGVLSGRATVARDFDAYADVIDRLNDLEAGTGLTDALDVPGSLTVGDALDHDGTTVGLYGTAPVAQAAAIADLTDSTGGVANDTIAAIPDPANTPADADTLRDDLVANALPAIRNAVADLAAKVNAILAAIRGIGIIDT
jgi:hypothetical protein